MGKGEGSLVGNVEDVPGADVVECSVKPVRLVT